MARVVGVERSAGITFEHAVALEVAPKRTRCSNESLRNKRADAEYDVRRCGQ